MKEAIITDLNGLYVEPTLVTDSVTGVFIIQKAKEYGEDEKRLDEPEIVDVGFTIAYFVPVGLYLPKFDLTSFKIAQEAYETALAVYYDLLGKWDEESAEDKPVPPNAVNGSDFWGEGLTKEEIDAMQPIPVLDPLETLGSQNVQRELEALELRTQNEAIGVNIVSLELRLLEMEEKSNV